MRELNEGIFTELTLAEVLLPKLYCISVFPIAHDVCVCMFLVIQVYMIHDTCQYFFYLLLRLLS